MTTQQHLIQDVHGLLRQLLCPFGWTVGWKLDRSSGWEQTVLFSFSHSRVEASGSYWLSRPEPQPLKRLAWEQRLPLLGLEQNSLYFQEVWPHQVAVDLMARSFRLLDPPLPTAPEVDWRPTEAIPEDFYAA